MSTASSCKNIENLWKRDCAMRLALRFSRMEPQDAARRFIGWLQSPFGRPQLIWKMTSRLPTHQTLSSVLVLAPGLKESPASFYKVLENSEI